jgi:hypothetical protein
MITFTDFEDEKGKVDWNAYHKARNEAGETCYKCHCYIVSLDNPGYKRLCGECKKIDEDEKLFHSVYIRCPKCREIFDTHISEDYELYSDGEHNIICCMCDH